MWNSNAGLREEAKTKKKNRSSGNKKIQAPRRMSVFRKNIDDLDDGDGSKKSDLELYYEKLLAGSVHESVLKSVDAIVCNLVDIECVAHEHFHMGVMDQGAVMLQGLKDLKKVLSAEEAGQRTPSSTMKNVQKISTVDSKPSFKLIESGFRRGTVVNTTTTPLKKGSQRQQHQSQFMGKRGKELIWGSLSGPLKGRLTSETENKERDKVYKVGKEILRKKVFDTVHLNQVML